MRGREDRRLGARRREAARELVHPARVGPSGCSNTRLPCGAIAAKTMRHPSDADPLDEQLGEPRAVDVERRPSRSAPEVLAPAPVDVRPPPARPGAAVDLDERVAHVHQRRVEQVRDARPGRASASRRDPGSATLVEARVEVHQLGDDRPDAAGAAHPLGVLVVDQRAVRDVEPDHRRVEPVREHTLRGLGVGPDVELGGRRAVALADRAAHQDDPLGHARRGAARTAARRSSAARSGRA